MTSPKESLMTDLNKSWAAKYSDRVKRMKGNAAQLHDPHSAPPPPPPPEPSYPFEVPASLTPSIITNAAEYPRTMNGISDRIYRNIATDGWDNGIMAEGDGILRVRFEKRYAFNCKRYGAWIEGVGVVLVDTRLYQASGATEHGFRAYGDQIVFGRGIIDSSAAGKSCAWLVDVVDACIQGSNLIGGAIRIGARPNDNQGECTAKNVWIRNNAITKSSGGDIPAVCIWPGSTDVHIEDNAITIHESALDKVVSIDERNTGPIYIHRNTVNGKPLTLANVQGFKSKVVWT